MDAQAHLISLGWAGPGHALDSKPQYKQKGHRGLAYNPALDPLKVGNTGNGLVKPLSISRRKDRFGIGKKSHEPASGTEWWLKGFENALGNIGKSESERSGTSTPTMGANGKHSGLYGFFIKGQVMEGTISQHMLHNESVIKKRKSDVLEDDATARDTITKKSKLNGLQVSPVRRKPESALDFATVGAFMRERDKQEQRRTKKEGTSDAEQFAQIGQFFAEAKKSDKSKKTKSRGSTHNIQGIVQECDSEERSETKEERRERRRKRKEEKEKVMRLDKTSSKHSDTGEQERAEDEQARAARKAERKRRKAEKEERRKQRS